MNPSNYRKITFMHIPLPKPKLKRSFNEAIAAMTFTDNFKNPTPTPIRNQNKNN